MQSGSAGPTALLLPDAPGARAAWLDFVAACYAAKGTPRAYFAAQLARDAAAGHRFTVGVVLAENGQMLSTAKIFHRRVRLGYNDTSEGEAGEGEAGDTGASSDAGESGKSRESGESGEGGGRVLSVAGVGAVCTAPGHRGQGLATRLLAFLAQECIVGGQEHYAFGLSLLHAREEFRPFYRARGWAKTLRVPFVYLTVVPKRSARARAAELIDRATGEPGRDLRAVMDVYEVYSGRLNGTEVRSDAYWREVVAQSGCTFFVAPGEDGEAVGYYAAVDRYVVDKESGQRAWRCLEFGAHSSASSSAQESLLVELIGHAIHSTMPHVAAPRDDGINNCAPAAEDSGRSMREARKSHRIEVPAGSRLLRQENFSEEDCFFDDGWLYFTTDGAEYASENAVRWRTDNF